MGPLPPLLPDLHATATDGGADRQAALRGIVQATHTATLFLKTLGAVDLAWVAADRAPVYGTSIITTAFTAQVRGEDPEEAIREAQRAAQRTTGTNAFWVNFSQTNVNQWRVSIAIEAGDPVKAAEVAAQVRLEDIPAKSRRVAFLIDHARALHALRGRDTEVVKLIHQAEKMGPTRTRNSIWTREMVSEMLLRSRRDAGGRELRGLADRMGMLSPL